MGMWRQYIVLRDRNGRAAQGFVKLFFTHQACNVSANLSNIQKGQYILFLWDGVELQSWQMHRSGINLRLQTKAVIQNGRVEVAIVDENGQSIAMGESCDPKTDWRQFHARILGTKKQENKQTEKKQEVQTHSNSKPEAEKKQDEKSRAVKEERENEYKSSYVFPMNAKPIESPTVFTAQGGQQTWQKPTITREEQEKKEDVPLVEELLQHAQPMEREKEERACFDVEQISQLVADQLQETERDECKEAIIIASDNHAMQAEELARQIQDALCMETEKQAPEQEEEEIEKEEEQQENSECVEDEMEDEESESEEMCQEEESTENCQADPVNQQESQNKPRRKLPMEENDEMNWKRETRGPVLGGEYAGQWKWKRVEAPSRYGYYLLGCVEKKGINVATAVAVPGEYAPQPPAYLQGFSIYRDGYWVLAQDGETGRTLAI